MTKMNDKKRMKKTFSRDEDVVVKRGRGRPRKVIDETFKSKVDVVVKKRGRPKRQARNDEVENESKVHKFKFIGYCGDCGGMIVETDIEEGKKFVYVCPKCGSRFRGNELLTVKDNSDRPKTKKEFLENFTVINDDWVGNDYNENIPNEIVIEHVDGD